MASAPRKRLEWLLGSLTRRMVLATVPLALLGAVLGSALAQPYVRLPDELAEVRDQLEMLEIEQALAGLLAEQSKHYTEYVYLPQEARQDVQVEIRHANEELDRLRVELVEPSAAAREGLAVYDRLATTGTAVMAAATDSGATDAREMMTERLLPLIRSDVDAAIRELSTGVGGQRATRAMAAGLQATGQRAAATRGRLNDATIELERASHSSALETMLIRQAGLYTEVIADPAFDPNLALITLGHDINTTFDALAAAGVGPHGDHAPDLDHGGWADAASPTRTGTASSIDQLRIAQSQMVRVGADVVALAKQTRTREATERFEDDLHSVLDDVAKPTVAHIHDHAVSALESHFVAAQRQANRIRVLVVVGLAVLWATAIGGLLLTARSVALRLGRLQDAARSLGEGDLTRRVEAGQSDELGRLARTFNRMAEDLAASRSALVSEAVLDRSSDVILVAVDGVLQHVAGAVADDLGVDAHALRERGPVALPEGPVRTAMARSLQHPIAGSTSLTHLHPERGTVHLELRVTDLQDDPEVGGIVLVLRDVTEQHASRAALQHRAFHDVLTGLPNRAMLLDRLHALLENCPADTPPAVLLCDLDGFKRVNDTLGHEAGDELLTEIGRRLAGSVPTGDLACRLGGDEFAIVLADGAMAEEVADRVLEALRPAVPLRNPNREVRCSTSIGIALMGDPGETASSLLRAADIALHEAKAGGKDRRVLFSSEMSEALVVRYQLEADLAAAIDAGEIDVYYQPQLDAHDGTVYGVEALARWTHPHRGPISPVEFIPIAEATGLIVGLGAHVLTAAVERVAAWQRRTGRHLTVSVNVSLLQLEDPAFEDMVRTALRDAGLAPTDLVLELTESALEGQCLAITDVLARLAETGVQLAIDDFGTGYSSFARLRMLRPAELKIDSSFVSGIGDPEESELITAMLAMGAALGVRVIAEGVETPDQAAFLRAGGCNALQGYLYAPPLPPSDLEHLLVRTGHLRGPESARTAQPA